MAEHGATASTSVVCIRRPGDPRKVYLATNGRGIGGADLPPLLGSLAQRFVLTICRLRKLPG